MPTFLLAIDEKVAISAMKAAVAKEMSFDAYVQWCLALQITQAKEISLLDQEPQKVEKLAKELLKEALKPTLFPDKPYLVEAIYRRLGPSKKWEDLDRGFRIMVGKAFKREVEAQSGDTKKRVEPFGRTQQNQALYKTVNV